MDFLQHVKIYALPCHPCLWNTYYGHNIENMIYLCVQICGFQVTFSMWKTSYILSTGMVSLPYEFSCVAASYSCHSTIFHIQNIWKRIHLYAQYCDPSSGISNHSTVHKMGTGRIYLQQLCMCVDSSFICFWRIFHMLYTNICYFVQILKVSLSFNYN